MDVVGVKAGCSLVLYSDSSFNGKSVQIDAYSTYDRSDYVLLSINLLLVSSSGGLYLVRLQGTSIWRRMWNLFSVCAGCELGKTSNKWILHICLMIIKLRHGRRSPDRYVSSGLFSFLLFNFKMSGTLKFWLFQLKNLGAVHFNACSILMSFG